MARSVDLRLLRATTHSPSNFALTRDASGQSDLVDFCIPCNPYFPTPGMFDRLRGSLEGILKYYPSDAEAIIQELCNTLGLHPQTVAMGNGSTELITWIDHLMVRESVAIPIPTFGRWTDQPLETGKRVDMFQLHESQGFRLDVNEYVQFIRERGSRVAVICNPNNPDGGYLPRQEVVRMMDLLNDLDLVIVDESFIDFVDAEPYRSVAEEAAIRPNVIVLKSLGKNFGLHGIRFGYMVSNPALAGRIRRALPKWNLNSFAEIVVFMLKEHQEEYHHSLRLLAHDRKMMYDQLSQLPGLTVLPSQGNFLLIKLPEGRDGVELRDFLIAEYGIYVRECGNKLGSNRRFLRLVVRPQPDVQRLLNGLFAFLYGVETVTPQPAAPAQVEQRPVAVADTDAQWAAALADLAASRTVTVADIVGARPAESYDPGPRQPAAVGGQAAPQRQVSITDTDMQWPAAALAELAAARALLTNSGQWPAVSPAMQAPPQAPSQPQVPLAAPVPAAASASASAQGPGRQPGPDETGAHWALVPDFTPVRPIGASDPNVSRPTVTDLRASRPTVADVGGGRPTVADVNARSGYAQLGVDDNRFDLAPKHSREQGLGTDWITIQRKGNTA